MSNTLNDMLRQLEIVEANLGKADAILTTINKLIPGGIAFPSSEESVLFDSQYRQLIAVYDTLPAVHGWKPELPTQDLDSIAQSRLDALEIGEIECTIATEREIELPHRIVGEYRTRFDQMRRALVRDAIKAAVGVIDKSLSRLQPRIAGEFNSHDSVCDDSFEEVRSEIKVIDVLLGSSVPRPSGWKDLQRHLRFGLLCDLHDIVNLDWPSVRASIESMVYGESEPIPTAISDLNELGSFKHTGEVVTKLQWEQLSEEDFERLVYSLISSENGYTNPQWLTKTNAPDRGRDLSVTRVLRDGLSGVRHERVILQCKHWKSKSVGISDVSVLKDQMALLPPPKIDTLVIATSGRFSSDAVDYIEKHNQSDRSLRIEMWPESHFEMLLASRPAMVAQFSLR